MQDLDYCYWKICVEEYPQIFGTTGAFRYELSVNRDEWRENGVILEKGSGLERKRVLVSPSRYIEFLRQRTKQAVCV